MKTLFGLGLIGAYLPIMVADHFVVETLGNDAGGNDSGSEDFIVDHTEFP